MLLAFKLAICVSANILIICLLYDENLSTYLTQDAITASTVKRLSEDDVHTNEIQTVDLCTSVTMLLNEQVGHAM